MHGSAPIWRSRGALVSVLFLASVALGGMGQATAGGSGRPQSPAERQASRVTEVFADQVDGQTSRLEPGFTTAIGLDERTRAILDPLESR